MRNFVFAAITISCLSLTGCDNDDKDSEDCAKDTGTGDTAAAVSCTDSTGTYAAGDSWTCPDGCNICACESDGSVISTLMACAADTGETPDTGSSDTGSDGTETATGSSTGTDTSVATGTAR